MCRRGSSGVRLFLCLASLLLFAVARPSLADTCTGMAGGPGDLDGDGFVGGSSDCDDTDPGLWARTQGIGQVKLGRAAGGAGAVLSWNPITDPGGSSASFTYEVVRSRVASNFATHPTATCLDPGGTELQFTDPQVPPSGGVFYYLVRGRNACGPGTAGTRSNGTPRDVKDCAFSVVCNDSNACTDDSAANGVCTHAAIAPKIITAPSSIGVCTGDLARFTVEAQNGAGVSYAWTKNGAPVGSNSPNLVLPPASLADHRSTIRVTVQDACGNRTTPDASLTVFSDPAACEGGLNVPPAPNGASDAEVQKTWHPANFRGAKDGPAARVDLHSGELEVAETDMEIRGRGFDFAFTRYYRSRRWQSTSQGVGWTHAYDRDVLYQADGLAVENPMYGEEKFASPPLGGSCYVSPPGVFEELCPQADGTLALTHPDGQIWIFGGFDGSATSGKILQSRDAYGNAMSFSYDTGGKLTTITDTLGRAITLTYNARSLISAVTDFTGRSVHYAYYDGIEAGGDLDDLKSVTTTPVTGTPTGNDFPQGRTTTYTYSNGFALGEENHNLLSITGPDGTAYARFSYSLTDNAADPAFDRLYRLQTYAGAQPADEMFTYVALTPDPSNDFAVSKTIVKDATDHRTDYVYDAQGRILRETEFTGVLPESPYFASDLDNLPGPPPSPGDPPSYDTKFQHDGNALLTELTLPSLSSVSRVYDSGNPSVRKRGDLLSETFHPGPQGGDQSEITRSWTYATPFGTDWQGSGETRLVHPPGTPPGTWRRISDVRIVHPPGTPPGTYRQIKDIRIVHPPGTPPGTWRRISDVRIVHPPGTPPGTYRTVTVVVADDDTQDFGRASTHPKVFENAVELFGRKRSKQNQQEVDPFAGQNAGGEKKGGLATGTLEIYVEDFPPPKGSKREGIWGSEWYTLDSDLCTAAARRRAGLRLNHASDDPFGIAQARLSLCYSTNGVNWFPQSASSAKSGYEKRDYTVQYQESDWDFVSRNGGSGGAGGGGGGCGAAREISPGRVIAIATSRDRTLPLGFGGTLPSAGFPTTATDETGQTWTFTYDTAGFLTDLTAPPVVTGTLTGAPQTIHHHWDRNAYGQIVAYTDPQSHVSTLDWSSSGPDNGYLRTLTIPAGTLNVGYQYTFSARGQLTSTTDPNGHTTTLTINDDDQLVRVTDPAPFSYQRDSYYDANGDLVRDDLQNVDENGVLRPNHYLSTLYDHDGLGQTVRVSREADDVQCAIDELEYDALGRVTKLSTGGSGPKLVEELSYARVKVRFPWLTETKDETATVWARQTFDFDADGNVTAMHDGIGPAAELADTTIQYDGYGRVTKVTDPEGNERSTHYDAASNVVSTRLDGELADGSSGPNVKLAECVNTFDEVGRGVKCECTHLRRANQTPIDDGLQTSLAFYDENSSVSRIQDDNGHGTDYAYDSGQRLHLVTDAMGNTTQLDYDPASNVTQVTETDAAGPGVPPASATTHYEYDALDRSTAVVDPAGGRAERKFDGKYLIVGVTHRTGNKSRYTYDGLGRLIQTQDDMTDTGDGNGNVVATLVTSQAWNDLSQVTSTTDAEGSTWSYAYDGAGRLSQKTAPDGRHMPLVWSPRSNLRTATDPDGSVSTLTSDKLGRLTDVSVVRGPGVAGTTTEHYVYDGSGALVSASDDDSLVTRTYDSFGRVLSETAQAGAEPPHTVTIDRDAVGNPVRVLMGPHVVTVGHDPLNRTQLVSADGALVAFYDYAGAGKLSRIVHGNSVGTMFGYDASGRLQRKTVAGAGGTVLDNELTWDYLGLVSRTDLLASSTTSYAYDSLHRLTKSTTSDAGGSSSRTYNLSAMGDRVLVIGGLDAGPYTRNPSLPDPADLQMHQYTDTPSGLRTYDQDGDPLTIRGGTPSQLSMTHDYRGGIVTAGGFSYAQDALGRYVLRAGVPLRFDSVNNEYVQDFRGGAPGASYVRGDDGTLLQMIEDSDLNGNGVLDRYTYHADEQGNVRALTDQSGAVVERYAYDDWGNPSFFTGGGTPLSSSLVGNPFLYRGMLWEPETQLYRTGSAVYDPHIGRPIRCPSGACRTESSAGAMTPFGGEPPPVSADVSGVIHWTLEVRVGRIEMK